MSHTIVPNYAKYGPSQKFQKDPELAADVQEHLNFTQALFESVTGDEDKADNPEDANYYEGCAWGLEGTLRFLTGKLLMIDPETGLDVVMSPEHVQL